MLKPRERKAFMVTGIGQEIEAKLNKILNDFSQWQIMFVTQSVDASGHIAVVIIMGEGEYL